MSLSMFGMPVIWEYHRCDADTLLWANYVIHPADKTSDLSKVHVLTTKERSYIQSFPESFEFVGTTSSIEQAIGNAVPVKMAEYVAGEITKYMKE